MKIIKWIVLIAALLMLAAQAWMEYELLLMFREIYTKDGPVIVSTDSSVTIPILIVNLLAVVIGSIQATNHPKLSLTSIGIGVLGLILLFFPLHLYLY